MCYVCLQDFDFELPSNPNLEQKKKRLLKVKSLLSFVSQINMNEEDFILHEIPICEDKIEELKEEQYKLSREF